jgi:ABC-2 type transport system ATP-binding protein
MQTVIETHQLTKRYGLKRAVDRLDLAVRAGEIFGYLGPNGAGKTTTIRLLLTLVRPTSGKVVLFGGETRGGPRRPLKQRIGYMPGELGLYENMTGAQLLNLCRDLGGGKAPLRDWLCEALVLPAADLRRRIRHYSKGMKSKLGIVQALQHDPDLIILDEPTDGLDPLVQMTFYRILRELKQRGRTVFFSSHVLSEMHRLCDRVGVLMEGKLILTTTIPEILAAAEKRLWLKLPLDPVRDTPPPEPPAIANAAFVRRDGSWLLYRVPAGDNGALLQDLARLQPSDFRFESAFEESFLSYYKRSGGHP